MISAKNLGWIWAIWGVWIRDFPDKKKWTNSLDLSHPFIFTPVSQPDMSSTFEKHMLKLPGNKLKPTLRFTKMQKAGHKNADPQTLTWWEWSKWWENIYNNGELHGGHEIANQSAGHASARTCQLHIAASWKFPSLCERPVSQIAIVWSTESRLGIPMSFTSIEGNFFWHSACRKLAANPRSWTQYLPTEGQHPKPERTLLRSLGVSSNISAFGSSTCFSKEQWPTTSVLDSGHNRVLAEANWLYMAFLQVEPTNGAAVEARQRVIKHQDQHLILRRLPYFVGLLLIYLYIYREREIERERERERERETEKERASERANSYENMVQHVKIGSFKGCESSSRGLLLPHGEKTPLSLALRS